MAYLGHKQTRALAVDDKSVYAVASYKTPMALKKDEVKSLALDETKEVTVSSIATANADKSLKEKLTELQKENDELKKDNSSLKDKLLALKKSFTKLTKTNKQLSKENEALRSEIENPLKIPSEFVATESISR